MLVLLTAFLTPAIAGDMPCVTPPKTSAALEQIKSLAGKWEGTAQEGQKAETKPAVAEYYVTSGGSAVEEKLFAGTPNEMISMYHDVKGKLSMTHYCMLGNQPQLEDKSSDASKIVLEESASSQTLLAGQMRMSSLTIEWKDKDHIVQTWQASDADGKPLGPTTITLKRV